MVTSVMVTFVMVTAVIVTVVMVTAVMITVVMVTAVMITVTVVTVLPLTLSWYDHTRRRPVALGALSVGGYGHLIVAARPQTQVVVVAAGHRVVQRPCAV